ncbi:MAG TPA: hypothetical protein VM661_19050 [Candidatus Sulfotelmatobacter sp.]|jgi:hypothetical protein|nr:hypothetical protein [Candidatus Sulfotelmatobacter sp.]
MYTSFRILMDHVLGRLADRRFEPPVGAMLLGTLAVYSALCVYGFSQL